MNVFPGRLAQGDVSLSGFNITQPVWLDLHHDCLTQTNTAVFQVSIIEILSLLPHSLPLKAHTMYQVGLMETDPHIEFFWTALEMFTQEELCKFIKFACNQERIPFTCPCKDGGPDTAHVPPYPMKIAPPDGAAGNGWKSVDSSMISHQGCYLWVTLV